MKTTRRQFLCSAATTVALPSLSRIAWAQAYPAKPITIVVPYAPGGPTDTIARLMAEAMKKTLGQPVVIDNVSGAGGSIGVGRVARAAPDGYTLSIGTTNTHVINGAAYNLNYNVLNDFEPIALLSLAPTMLVSKSGVQASTVPELVTWLKANRDKASAGTTGSGSMSHLLGLAFQNSTGTQFQFVPYRGSVLALQDLVASHIDLLITDAATALPFVRDGKIKAFAVLAKSRWFAAPEIPTSEELNLPALNLPFWHGLWGPKGTPPDVVAKLNSAAVTAFADPAVRDRFGKMGLEFPSADQQSPAALGAYNKAETDIWWPIVKAANIKLE